MRGRKPTPTVLKLLRNNPGRRRFNPDEPQPQGLAHACPDELTDEEAQREWARAIVPAIRIGLITSSERASAIAHCELWATWRSQLLAASMHPHVVASGPHKHPIPNPARVMANRTLLLMMKVDSELGLTPSSRSRVQIDRSSRKASTSEAFKAKKHA